MVTFLDWEEKCELEDKSVKDSWEESREDDYLLGV